MKYPTRLFSNILCAILVVAGICLWEIHVKLNVNLNPHNKDDSTSTTTHSMIRPRRRATIMTAITQNPDFKLPLCGGDCDTDNDCEEGLICFQRRSTEPAPGCNFPDNGQLFKSLDVCVADPSFQAPSDVPSISPAPSPAPYPTSAPTPIGTNSWAQTWGNTDAFQFVGPPSTPAPTTERQGRQDWTWIFNYTEPQPLQLVGDNGQGPFPLGPCQADCDSDLDCAGPLECFQRQGGESVPGCLGEDDPSNEDFCVWPDGYNATEAYLEHQELATPNPWDEGFCLKLYWQEGYNWQNETMERKWCISRDYPGTPGSGKCWHGLDQIDCDPDEMYIDQCSHTDLRQRFRFVPVSSDEVLIQASRGDPDQVEDRCFHRDNRKIKLMPCNQQLHNQRWFAIRGGFNQERFELSQKTLSDHCVNQDHHPKFGEVMRMHSCEKTRRPNHLTSWWVVY